MDRICVGVALPVRSALPAMLASALLGGFSGVVFLAILVLPFKMSSAELATTRLLTSVQVGAIPFALELSWCPPTLLAAAWES
jgi:hypothetical protein